MDGSLIKLYYFCQLKMVSSILGNDFSPEKPRSSSQLAAGPKYAKKKVTLLIQRLSRRACLHPIYTVVLVALLASTTYIGLLESSLFDAAKATTVDWQSLQEGSTQLQIGPETEWKWRSSATKDTLPPGVDHLAVMTLVFPNSLAKYSPSSPLDTILHLKNLSITILPPTPNPSTTASQGISAAYSVPISHISDFLAYAQELPNIQHDKNALHEFDDFIKNKQRKWIMKTAKAHATKNSVESWARETWLIFRDSLRNAEALDITIMVLGYLSMHLTFISLLISMRKMGSNFWLFGMTLLSSTFAFLFGLIITTKMGVALNLIVLSEGLPFLVVTIGFEKTIILTKAVLSAALETRRPKPKSDIVKSSGSQSNYSVSPTSIQYAVQIAIEDKGAQIVRDYAIEILVLVIGAMSGVEGGLQQFCFLAAWILFFDCILLFTFYTAILIIKLEINRIKRHVTLRQALEDDGINQRVAEHVAQSNEWPKSSLAGSDTTNIFGRKVQGSSIPKFKILMVSGFIIINVLNICTIPFRGSKASEVFSITTSLTGQGLLNGIISPSIDPFLTASSGLDAIRKNAQTHNRLVVVDVIPPIRYELEDASIYHGKFPRIMMHDMNLEEMSSDTNEYGVSGRVVNSLLKSLEDPILSKWILATLIVSIALNGYLFNAARWSIQQPIQVSQRYSNDPVEIHKTGALSSKSKTGIKPHLIFK